MTDKKKTNKQTDNGLYIINDTNMEKSIHFSYIAEIFIFNEYSPDELFISKIL